MSTGLDGGRDGARAPPPCQRRSHASASSPTASYSLGRLLALVPTLGLLGFFSYYPDVNGLIHSLTNWEPGFSSPLRWTGQLPRHVARQPVVGVVRPRRNHLRRSRDGDVGDPAHRRGTADHPFAASLAIVLPLPTHRPAGLFAGYPGPHLAVHLRPQRRRAEQLPRRARPLGTREELARRPAHRPVRP